MSLLSRVEDYVGSFSDLPALDLWLTQGAHRLIDLVGEQYLGPFALNTGFEITEARPLVGAHRIWSVNIGGHTAVFVPASKWEQVKDVKSIYRASPFFPVWTWLSGIMLVYPIDTTTFNTTPKSLVSHTDSTIAFVPEELVQAVVLYAAINARLRQLNNTLADGVSSLVFEQVGLVPTAPTLPAFTHTPATSAVSLPSSVTLPIVAPPEFSPPAHTIDFSKILEYIETEEDPELASAKANEIATRIRDYEALLSGAVQTFQGDALVYQQTISQNVKEAELTLQALIASANHSVDLSVRNADAETARQVAEYAAKLNKYSTEVQAYLGVAQGEAQRFDAEVKRVTMDLSGMQGQLQNIRGLYLESLQALGLAPAEAQREAR